MSHVARKRFGQNFLVDAGVIDAIVSAVRPRAGEHLVEIGPGLGALTNSLLSVTPHLHAIEIDRDLIERLRRRYDPGQLTLHEGDVLGFDFASLPQPLRIVGNLPYNISTPLLFHLMPQAHRVADQHFMLQKEVVDRMVAEPGSKVFGRLSVMLQYRYDCEALFDVPPEAFDPAPQVTSSIVRMIPRPKAALQAQDEALLSELVAAGFSQRRKMLRNALAPWRETLPASDWPFAPTDRAEQVPVSAWVELSNRLHARRGEA